MTSKTFTIKKENETVEDVTIFFNISNTTQENINYDIEGVYTKNNKKAVVNFDGEKGSVVIPNEETSVDLKILPKNNIIINKDEKITLTITKEVIGTTQKDNMDSTLEDEITDLIITDNNNVSSQVAKNNEVVISANESVSQVVSAANVNNVNDISKENLDSNIKQDLRKDTIYSA